MIIRVSGPAHFRVEIQRCAQGKAGFIRNEYACFPRDQLGGEIGGMAVQTILQAPVLQYVPKKRSQVSLKAIMSHQQFIKLAACRKVLILERLSFAFSPWAESSEGDFIIDRGQNVPAS